MAAAASPVAPTLSSFAREGNAGVIASSRVSIDYVAAGAATVRSVSFDYTTPTGSTFEAVDAEPDNSGHVASGDISAFAPAGGYTLTSASVTDAAGSRTTYGRDGSVSVYPAGAAAPSGAPPELAGGDFIVLNPGQDITAPELDRVGVTSPPAVAPGHSLSVTYAAHDAGSGLVSAQLTFDSSFGQSIVVYDATPSSDGSLRHLSVAVPKSLSASLFRLTDVQLTDAAGNAAELLSDGSILRTPLGLTGASRSTVDLRAADWRVSGGEVVAVQLPWVSAKHGRLSLAGLPRRRPVSVFLSVRCLRSCGAATVGGQALQLSANVPQTVILSVTSASLRVSGHGSFQARVLGWTQPTGSDAATAGSLHAIKPKALRRAAHNRYVIGVPAKSALLSIATSCVKPRHSVCAHAVRLEVVPVSHGRAALTAAPAGTRQTVTLVGVTTGKTLPFDTGGTKPTTVGNLTLTSKTPGQLMIGAADLITTSGFAVVRVAVSSRLSGRLTVVSAGPTSLTSKQFFVVDAGHHWLYAAVPVAAASSLSWSWSGRRAASVVVTLVGLTGA
jgi:hypothetical protein